MLKKITAFLLVMVLLFSCIQISEAVSYKRLKKGSRGTEVKQLQTELKKLGYYNGKIDGIFGNGTLSGIVSMELAEVLRVSRHNKSYMPSQPTRNPLLYPQLLTAGPRTKRNRILKLPFRMK